jgi:hypothetical protein
MSEQLPAPDFDARHYARPNQNWVCGHAGEGVQCPLGPDAKGRCRATGECKPVLELAAGETKGRWRCTSPGGACASGPLPNGSCGRPISQCSPTPTLRRLRGQLTLTVVAAACAVLLIALGNRPWRNRFISPGEISQAHVGAEFARLAQTNQLSQSCGACHVAGNSGPSGLVNAAWQAHPSLLNLRQLTDAKPAEPTGIDTECLKCHGGRNFHQPDAPQISCGFCHAEHQGRVMARTTEANCIFCHGDATKMAVSRGASVIHHFADDHPQFRFITEKRRDADTLKFNHALHLTGATIPRLPGGQKLDCTFCHQPDATGAYMRPVAFEKNCRVCHSLQFDPATPQLMLPHGSAEFVSDFLRSLPKQYRELAQKQSEPDVTSFVENKLAGLRTEFGSGEDLEQRIFFSTAMFGPQVSLGTLSGSTRAIFPGCTYCHEVKRTDAGSPNITKPVMPERWLAEGKFNHAKHVGITCAQCHDAVHSQDTADIILPPKETCAVCHSSRGGVASFCTECHAYHQPQMAAK